MSAIMTTNIQKLVHSIIDGERHYSALLQGLILQVKRDPVMGPRWKEAIAHGDRKTGVDAALSLLRETPTYGGIVKRIEAYVEELAKLMADATKAMRSGTPDQRLVRLLEMMASEEFRRQEIERLEGPTIPASELNPNMRQGGMVKRPSTTH
ncbi:hypothetical protein [Rhizobium fabae]|uniref:Uncharacterized protein n=1 Tax=Rhizobium fabae TaxID=573179 RepID=A0A7W6B4R0_9HYPH|nr:hypothetical protein [Rhizobium fabae]MBB3915565.1 hypothetical protein [Rhizobium fabae]RUM11853.1 hypothetical protein EFB14_15810 [Rhizobium fabae]